MDMNDVSRRTHQAMETAMAGAATGAAEVGRVGRRIVKMLWDPVPTNDRALNRPVWCLGHEYKHETKTKATFAAPDRDPSQSTASPSSLPSATDPATSAATAPVTPPDSSESSFSSSLVYDDPEEDDGWPQSFLDDFESRIWMTYRSEFEPIPRSTDPKATAALSLAMRIRTLNNPQAGFSSDTGWGCMIRSGQSLLANTLAICDLGRNWRRGMDDQRESEILACFADDSRAPYSIHNFVRHGAVACGKYPGAWFGPSAAARCIQALVNSTSKSLRVYTTNDSSDVYEDSFMAVAKPDGETFHPTLILVSTMLGTDKLNQVYYEALTAALQMPQSVGIAGGRPAQSYYFVGAQRAGGDSEPGSYLFYLDPHFTRPALPYREDGTKYSVEEIGSCHTRRLRRLHIREIDPSMMIGFLIKDEDDWDSWKDNVKYVQGRPVVNVADHDPSRGSPVEREEAIDEVETLSDDDDDTIQDV